jgi:hypothetical protein
MSLWLQLGDKLSLAAGSRRVRPGTLGMPATLRISVEVNDLRGNHPAAIGREALWYVRCKGV